MEERLSIKEQRDYYQGVASRGYRLQFLLGGTSVAGVCASAVSYSLFSTDLAQSEMLPVILGGSLAFTAISLGALYFVNKTTNKAVEEVDYLEDNFADQIEKEEFMERVTSYGR